MNRRRVIAAACLALALAGAPAGAPAGALAADREGPPKDAGQFVDLLPVALPIVVDGRLVNYVFVHVRINLTPSALPSRVRLKEPQLRDALVRAGHRTPFTLATDYSKIDTAKLAATLKREAEAITGPGQIKSVAVTAQQPRRRVAAPKA